MALADEPAISEYLAETAFYSLRIQMLPPRLAYYRASQAACAFCRWANISTSAFITFHWLPRFPKAAAAATYSADFREL